MKLFKRKDRSQDDYYHRSIYKPDVIKNQYVDFDSAEHREERVKKDRIAHNVVIKVAKLITSRSPIFLDKNENEMDDVKEGWEKNGYNKLFKEVIISTRTHGYCVTEFLKKKIGSNAFLVHDSTDIVKIQYMEDFSIENYTILPDLDYGEETSLSFAHVQRTLDPKKVIHYFVGKFDYLRQGLSTLEPIWSGIVRYSEIEEAMASYDSRIGNGVLHVSVPVDLYSGEISNLKKAVEKMKHSRFLLTKYEKGDKPPLMEFLGSNVKQDFPHDMYMILKGIAASVGFPVRFLIGDPKGALSAADKDDIATWENLKSIFGEYKDFIREIILMQENGEVINESIKEIKFDSGGHLDQDDAEELDKNKEDVGLVSLRG